MKDPELYIEMPGTWLTFDFDNHPGMETGIMTYTHGLTIELTLQVYTQYIGEAQLSDHPQFLQILELFREAVEYGHKIRALSD